RAIVSHAQHRLGLSPDPATAFRSEAGVGVSGVVGGRRIHVASVEEMTRSTASDAPQALTAFLESATARGATVVCVGGETAGGALDLLGAIAIADAIRDTSREAVGHLQSAGLRVVMLSGDRPETARAVAAQVGITEVVAGVLPTGKVEEIRRLQREGTVGMVGDGVNDAPALAQADVGFAMGTGTDAAIQAADITLMRPDLRLVGASLDLAHASLRIMRQNLFWAFAYNVVAIPLAAGVLYPTYGVLLSPTVASAAMALSSVSVVANSLRLRRARIGLS
ncbi:MAG TPA: HAD-IC family P-type ATPase, partial [Vicinamibacterales bacterium]